MAELQESSIEFSINDLITSIFSLPPNDPFTIRLELVDQTNLNEQTLINVLQDILMQGCRLKFKKALHALNHNEAAIMRQYFQSFGWDVPYEKEIVTKQVVDYHEDGTPYNREVSFNYWKFTFTPADQSLNKYNSHTMPSH
jgi:hypothetical protein